MRPLDLGQTLDLALTIVRERWRTLALLVVAVVAPIELIDLIVTAVTSDNWSVSTNFSSFSTGTKGTAAGAQAVVAVLTLLSYLLGTVACLRVVTDAYLGRPSDARASLRLAFDRLGPALWASILFAGGVIVGLIAFVVPGVWLMVAWSVAIPALLVEGVSPPRALGRSAELVRGRWWATLGRFFVAYVIVWVVGSVVTVVLLAGAVAVVDQTSFAALVVLHVGNLIGSVITTPLIAAVTVLVYFDLRARKEGFDPRAVAGDAPAAGEPALPGGWAPPVAPEPLPRDEPT